MVDPPHFTPHSTRDCFSFCWCLLTLRISFNPLSIEISHFSSPSSIYCLLSSDVGGDYTVQTTTAEGLVEQHGGLDRVSFLPPFVSLAWLYRVETFNNHHCRSRPFCKINQVAIPGTLLVSIEYETYVLHETSDDLGFLLLHSTLHYLTLH